MVVLLALFPPGKAPAQTFQTPAKKDTWPEPEPVPEPDCFLCVGELEASLTETKTELLIYNQEQSLCPDASLAFCCCGAPSASLVPRPPVASPNPGTEKMAGRDTMGQEVRMY